MLKKMFLNINNSQNVRSRLINIFLLLCSLLLTLSLVEMVFRYKAYVFDKNLFDFSTKVDWPKPPKKARVGLAPMVKSSSNKNIIYELKPLLDVYFVGAPTQTNSLGFRDNDHEYEKREGVVRIVGLGDSVMFGQGVPQNKDYLSVLETYLNDNCSEGSGLIWEVINMAVPGYNTVMEVETLKDKGLAYKPDVVILGYVGNDINLPNFIRNTRNYWGLSHSFAIEYIKDRLKNGPKSFKDINSLKKNMDIPDPFVYMYGKVSQSDQYIPQEYRKMTGKDAVISKLHELRSLSIGNGFKVVLLLVSFTKTNNFIFIEEEARKLGFEIVTTYEDFEPIIKEHNISKILGSKLAVSIVDNHPSAYSQKIIGSRLFKHLKPYGCLGPS